MFFLSSFFFPSFSPNTKKKKKHSLTLGQRQLDLQHSVREPRDLRPGHGQSGVPVPPARLGARRRVVRVLLDHHEVGVERDADRRVEGDLEGSAPVLSADHGRQLLGVDLAVDLLGQGLELGRLLGALPFRAEVLCGVGGGVPPFEEGDDAGLGQGEALFHGLLALPGLAVGLALDEAGFGGT